MGDHLRLGLPKGLLPGDRKEIPINVRNWVDLAQDMERPCECCIKPLGSIIHVVSLLVVY